MRQRHRTVGITAALALAATLAAATVASAQVTQRQGVPDSLAKLTPQPPPPAPLPSYLIGADDVLLVTVWHAPEVSGEVKVRPDGKITLPVGNDIVALGLTTEELKGKVTEELGRFYDAPTVFVQVKEINSRFVFITGAVNKQGPYRLTGSMNVLQLISAAGGLLEFADKKNLMLVSGTLKGKDGKPMTWRINYDDMSKGRNFDKYNIELRPGDQLIVR